MPETTVGLPDNNLFANLIANTRPSQNNPGAQTLDINSIQSDTEAEDLENINDIPFQEILGQHMSNSCIHSTTNSPVPSTPAVESADTELAQESAIETNPFVLYEQILNTLQPADILQKTSTPHPESTMQDFGNNLFPSTGKTAGSDNLTTYNPFPNARNEDAPYSPFAPLSQRGSKWGFEEQKGIGIPLDKQVIETRNPSSIFYLEKPFIQDMDFRNTLPKTDTLKLNPSNITETPQVSGESLINNMQQSDLYSSDSSEINIKELPETYKLLAQNISPENKNSIPTPVINSISKNTAEQHTDSSLSKINGTSPSRQDISGLSQSNDEWNPFGSNTQKQKAYDTSSFDAHIQKTNNGAPFPLDSQTTTSNAQSNVSDFQQNTQGSPNSGAALSSSLEDAKNVNHMFHSNDTSNVGHAQENIMEQILQKIRITTHGDRSEIKLSLNPPELGNMKIHFMEENDEIKAKIFVENAEVKAAIENNKHHLKESVASNGIDIHKLEVYIQNNDANKQNSLENFNANNPHHNQTHSQKGYDADQVLNEEDITNNLQTETSANTSNLMVDYLI
ncbi:MAG: flagellar hook-length control protein FliK [Planctomycetes bacterium]|nr:flagellar hook-length control protein FliK [Planctomycetota bacterium]